MDVSKWIDYWSNWAPRKRALRFEGNEITYGDLETAVARTAGRLLARGVGRGDRVAYLGPNCPELLEIFFACARIGAIFVPLNARMPAPELDPLIALADPALLIAETELRVVLEGLSFQDDRVETFVVGDGRFDGETVNVDPEADPSMPLLIAFTSGTTGTPKGAVHTNAGILSNAQDVITALGISSSDEILSVLPMFHVAGLNILTVPALAAGATVTIHRRFDPSAALNDIECRGATLFLVAPQMAVAMASDPRWDAFDLSSLRAVLIGGTTVPKDSVDAWLQRDGRVVQGYGMTEVGPAATFVPAADVPRKTLTAGKPTLHTRLRIVDRAGDECPPGEPGEVTVRGPSVTTGYWRNPAATRDAFKDGWFLTGDLGFLDDEGFLHIIDRIKEIIIVGTSNVYPADVEAVLAASPSIAEAAVVAAPDRELGEVPIAFVVLNDGASMDEGEAIRLFEGRLAEYKHPRRVLFVDSLPRTSIGKVEKKTLRAMAREALEMAALPHA